ncbi:hypothetical protein [Mycoplasma buteonis]|uniref:hypothetical protein n=1 Tax=Mycoplasma buteonis TaxID=171280 RepID=UPI00055B9FCC|nr:hypothetical protein [Mycoplasma buteonis]
MFNLVNDNTTIAQLWESEKQKYRPWIITLGIGILILLAFAIAMVIYPAINYQSIYAEIEKSYKTILAIQPESSQIIRQIIFNIIGYALAILVILSLVIAFYIKGVISSYKAKDFSKLSNGSLLTLSFLGFYNLFQILWNAIFNSGSGQTYNFSDDAPTLQIFWIIQIVFVILTVLIWLGVQIPVSRIRKQFNAVHIRNSIIEQQRQMMQYLNDFQKNNAGFNFDFSQMNQDQTTEDGFSDNQETEESSTAQETQTVSEEQKTEIKKLLELPNEQLFEIAKMLKIYGYETMSKQELAEKIYSYTQMHKNDKEKK